MQNKLRKKDFRIKLNQIFRKILPSKSKKGKKIYINKILSHHYQYQMQNAKNYKIKKEMDPLNPIKINKKYY